MPPLPVPRPASARRRRSTPRDTWRRWWPPLVFGSSAALLVVTTLARLPLPPIGAPGQLGFFDLQIYREGAGLVLNGGSLYSARFAENLGFTYPPFAAILFTALRAISLRGDEIVVTIVNVGLFAALSHCAMRLEGAGPDRMSAEQRARLAWPAAAVVLWVAPVTSAIGFGQIDIVIAVLVLFDLTVARRGTWIGLAAAIKLTPLIFIPYLALTGWPRMAGRALGWFALSIAVGYDALGSDSRAYWLHAVFGTRSVTGKQSGRSTGDQSLRAAILRLVPHAAAAPAWLICAGLTGAVGLLLATRATRRGEEAWGFQLVAVTALLISPITWIHHWVIATPGLMLLLARWRRSRRDGLRAAAALALALGARMIDLVIVAHPDGAHLGVGGLLLGDVYPIIGGATILAGVGRELVMMRRRRRRRRPRGPRGRAGSDDAAAPAARPAQPTAATPVSGSSRSGPREHPLV